MAEVELTTAQIAAKVGVSERTIQRWIAKGTLTARPSRSAVHYFGARPKNRYWVDEDQLAALATETPDDLAELKTQVAALTRRVEELERQAQEESTRPKARMLRPVSAYYHVDQDDQGSELTLARTFAEVHGFTRDRMAGWIKRGEVQTTPVNYGSQGQTQHKLTPSQEQAIIAFWEREGLDYERCPRCPHEPQSGPLQLR